MRIVKNIVIIVLISFGFVASAQNTNEITKETFKNPPIEYRPISGNYRPVPKDELIKQLEDVYTVKGFGGSMFAPTSQRGGFGGGNTSSPEYLSKEYFDNLREFLSYTKETGHKAVFYDEVGYPSGSANSTLPEKYYRKELGKTEVLVTGPTTYKATMPEEGKLMSVVAMNEADKTNRIDLTPMVKNGSLEWNVPAGEWKIMVFNARLTQAGIRKFGVDYNAAGDLFDPEAVQWFVDAVYEPHLKEVGEYFGNTITMTFFDDIGIGTFDYSWAYNFNEKFKEKTGKDASIYYPALWEDIGPETEAARVAFFDTRAEMLADGFPKIVSDWGKKNNVTISGHAFGAWGLQPVADSGDPFKFYREQPIPMQDVIMAYPLGREGFKFTSDGAEYYDKPIVAAETFPMFTPGGKKAGYRRAMELFIRGINLFVGADNMDNRGGGMFDMFGDGEAGGEMPEMDFSMFGDMPADGAETEGETGGEMPEIDFSMFADMFGGNNEEQDTVFIGEPSTYAEWAGRISMLLQGGRRVSDIAVYYPISDLEGYFHFEHPDTTAFMSLETDYYLVGELLLNNVHRDYTYLHPDFLLSDKIKIKGNSLEMENKVNHQSFKTLIFPSQKVTSLEALKKIQAFYEAGGIVIATTQLPSKSDKLPANAQEALENDKEIQKIIKEMFEIDPTQPMVDAVSKINTSSGNGKAVFIGKPDENKLSAILEKLEVSADVIFEGNPQPNSGNACFSYVHKVKEGMDIYFFANSTDDNVDTFAELRGKIEPQLWDPHTGETTSINDVTYIKKRGQDYTRVPLNLDPVKTVFVVGK